ncbi:unnamed protein product [Macrosiphum euphorbiae]|uniref:Peptidase aspartic putative domain-containing protein n=1 Tax=Macrosiphum euphorbiae TaxID=13131 RepID=A0AAV0WD15_9HEMI|nr:unnamed protein product [Macrosiphum euphorbiae]
MSMMTVLVQDSSGQYQEARALLDSGSQSSFLTEHCRNRLGVTRDKCSVAVQDMAGLQVPLIKARTQIIIRSVRRNTSLFPVETFILPRITVEKTSPAEQKCEEIYRTTTTRQVDG